MSSDTEKYFHKLWFKESLNEVEKIGNKTNDTKILHEMNNDSEIVIDTLNRRNQKNKYN